MKYRLNYVINQKTNVKIYIIYIIFLILALSIICILFSLYNAVYNKVVYS